MSIAKFPSYKLSTVFRAPAKIADLNHLRYMLFFFNFNPMGILNTYGNMLLLVVPGVTISL